MKKYILSALLVLIINNIIHAQCACTTTSYFPATINGVNVTVSNVGDIADYGANWPSCGLVTGPLWVGQNSFFSQTFYFSTPVNNVKYIITAANGDLGPESFDFTVSSGVLLTTQCGTSCPFIQSANTFTATGSDDGTTVVLSSSSPYTSFTVSGPGGGNGSLIGLCVESIIDCSTFSTSAGSSQTIDCNTSAVVLNGSQSGGTAGFSYSWSPSAGLNNAGIATPTATPGSSTNYTLTVTDGNGCTSSSSAFVTVDNAAPSANAGASQTIDCNTTAVILNGSGSGSYSWSPSAGLNNAGIATPTATPGSSTNYTLTVTGSNGCTATSSAFITVDNAAPSANAGASQTIDCNTTAVMLNGSGSGSYSWSPSTGLNNAGIATPTATPGSSTNYILTVTGANGCTNTSSAFVTVDNAVPTANAGSAQTINCSTTAVVLNGSGSGSYSWSPSTGLDNAGIATPTATPGSSTNYVLTVTGANGCTNTSSAFVTVDNAVPSANAGSAQTINCSTTAVVLNGSGSGSYSWSPNTGLDNAGIATPTATPSSSTNYVLTVTGANGCTNTSSAFVTVDNALPTANAGTDKILACGAPSATLNGSGSGTYGWSPTTGLSNATIANPTASPSTTTTYILTVTGSNGCTATDAVDVTIGAGAFSTNAGSNDTINCTKNSVTLTALTIGGTPTYYYNWYPTTGLSDSTIATVTATPTSTTTYTLTITDSSGCLAIDNVTITVDNAAPIVNAGLDDTLCEGTSTLLTASGGVSYSWSPSAGLDNAGIATPTANPSTSTTYVVSVVGSNGCVGTDAVVVNINAKPTAFATSGVTDSICAGNTLTVTSASIPNVTTYLYSSLNGGTAIDSIPFTTGALYNDTTYYFETISKEGCKASASRDSVHITINALPTASTITTQPSNSVCYGLTDSINTTSVAGVVTNVYASAISSIVIGTLNYVTPPITATTTYYFETINTTTGCSANSNTGRDSVTITMLPRPINTGLTAYPTATLCLGDSTVLNTNNTAGNTVTWYNSNLSTIALGNDSIKISPSVSQYYYAEIINALGCKANEIRDSIQVSVVTLAATPSLPPAIIKCGNSSSITLIVNGTYPNSSYNWVLPSGVAIVGNAINDTIITNWNGINTGNVYVMELNAACMSDTASSVLTSYATPTAIIDTVNIGTISEAYTFVDSSVIALPQTIKSWAWNFGDEGTSTLQNPSHLYTNVGSYPVTLIVSSNNGCKDTATLTVNIREGVKFSNVFSPNGDGLNDYFMFPNLGLEGDYKLEIFDRWGLLLFDTEGKNVGWDGRTIAGKPVADGAYYYVLQAKSKTKEYNNKGIIMVMK
ncbi:MAG: gliding motility-associated C-terminal domain-containing protein [Bacteroidia bacterium]